MKTDIDKFGVDEYEDVVTSVLKQYEVFVGTKQPSNVVSDEARMAGCLVRMAGHDLMDFRRNE